MWEDELVLEPGCKLRLDREVAKGHLGQEEISSYSILDAEGQVVGTVQYTDYTSIKGSGRRSQHVVQRDAVGRVVVDKAW